jgi:HSP20 family protein
MANIIRRNQSRDVAASPSVSPWDPFRLMREVMRWDPYRELEGVFGGDRAFAPSFEVKETKDAYVFKAELPGLKEEDVEIALTGNRLTISGHREQEREDQNDQYYASEFSYGSFSRTFTLPDGTDWEHVRADMKNGVLTVSVPKKPEVQPRRISIESSGAGAAGDGGAASGNGDAATGSGGTEKAKK